MAFQLALDALSSTSHKDPSLHPVLESVHDSLRHSLTELPWAIPRDQIPYLLQAGIPTSGLGTTPHPHPIHKTLETNLLFNHWSFLATQPSSILFMKPSKFAKLQRKNPNFSHLHNYRTTAIDTVRYPTTSPHLPTTPVVFIHDALMYYTPEQILHLFEACPNLTRLHASLVVPPESHFTHLSLHPDIYQFSMTGHTLHYTPEGHSAGSYNQPISALSWLKISSILSPSLQLSVSVLESWGPLHSILIQRGLPLPDPKLHLLPPLHHPPNPSLNPPPSSLFSSHITSIRDLTFFRFPAALALPQATFLNQPLRDRLVPKAVYDALFTYTRAVRTLRTSDPAGFVRTQSNKPEHRWVTPSAWDNLQTFALLNCTIRPNVLYSFHLNPISKLKLYLTQHWRRLAATAAPTLSFLILLPRYLQWSLPLPKVKSISAFRRSYHFSQPTTRSKTAPRLPKAFPPMLSNLLTSLLNSLSTPLTSPPPWKDQIFLHPKIHSFLHLLHLLPPPPRKASLFPRLHFSFSSTKIRPPVWLALAACLVPEFFLLVSRLTGDVTLQQQHDTYHHHLHPEAYSLQWERVPYTTSHSTPFLPFDPLPVPAPPPGPSPPFTPHQPLLPPPPPPPPTLPPIPENSSPPTSRSPPPPRPPSPEEPSASDAPSSTTSSPSTQPPTPPPPPPAATEATLPPTSYQVASPPTCPPAPHQSDPLPLEPCPIQTPPPRLRPPDLSQASPPTPSAPTIPHSSPMEPSTSALPLPPPLTPHSPRHNSHPPPSDPLFANSLPTPSDPPLLTDPTCTGPVLSFSELHPRKYHPLTADFQTRLRVLPATPLPMPENNCLLTAVAPSLHMNPERLWAALQELLPDCLLDNPEVRTFGLSTDILTALSHYFNFQAEVLSDGTILHYGIQDAPLSIHLLHTAGPPGHYSPPPKLFGSQPPSLSTSHPLIQAALRFTFRSSHLPFSQAHPFTTSTSHAKNLISNMKNGFDGVLASIDPGTKHQPGHSPRDKILALDRLVDVAHPRTLPVIHIAGFAGCGKTLPLQHLLRTRPFHNFRVSVPTTELRNEWKNDLSLPSNQSFRFNTWESSLLKQSKILVIDEIYKLPRGYLDLSILADPSLELVFILGDPLQGEYHSTSPHSSNAKLPREALRFLPLIDHYCWWTHRVPSPIASLFNIPSFNQFSGPFSLSVRMTQSCTPGQHNLVNSMATAAAVNQLGFPACTISASQGMTFRRPVTVLLDKHTRLLSPSNTLVALTRSTHGVEFLGDPSSVSGGNNASDMFSRALHNTPINLHTAFPDIFPLLPLLHEPIKRRSRRLVGSSQPTHLRHPSSRPHLPPHVPVSYTGDFILTNPALFGSSDERRIDTSFLPPTRLLHLDLLSAPPSTSLPTQSQTPSRTPHTPVYPGESFETLAAFFLPAHDPSTREILHRDQLSNQFPWFDRPFSLSCQPSSLISAKQPPPQDPPPLPPLIPKRLPLPPPEPPHLLPPHHLILRQAPFPAPCRAYRRDPLHVTPFNPALFAECIALNDYAQLSSKTKATIVANASRSDPDWRHTAVKIFAKAQHKVNDGSIFGSWKACQTLALMHDYVILTLGPVKKYQRLFDKADSPPHLYTHCGKTPTDLSDWCHTHLTPGPKLTNDYTAFDQSQHGESVVLEALKMKRLSIPPHLISLHIHLKTNVSTQFGPLTCMRLTGEPGTYDDNTDYNLAVIYSQFEMGRTPVMVSGDDSLLDTTPPSNPNWPSIQRLLHLRFKTEITQHPLFCGYYVGPAGAIRNPLALFAKLAIAVDDDALPDRRLSYLTEFSIGHALGDSLWDLLPDATHPYQSACFDFFCRHCPPHEKLLLSLDTPRHEILSSITSSARWLSHAAFSALPSRLRKAILAFSQSPSYHDNPEVSLLESELLHSFQ
ncbi:replicase [Alcea yellow mosaic virus]|nr:replicase [Alcea yellow mosaic virus]